jgi:hypothetical protein
MLMFDCVTAGQIGESGLSLDEKGGERVVVI